MSGVSTARYWAEITVVVGSGCPPVPSSNQGERWIYLKSWFLLFSYRGEVVFSAVVSKTIVKISFYTLKPCSSSPLCYLWHGGSWVLCGEVSHLFQRFISLPPQLASASFVKRHKKQLSTHWQKICPQRVQSVFLVNFLLCICTFIYAQILRFPLGPTPALLLVPPCTPLQTSWKKCFLKAYLLIHSSVSSGPPPPTRTLI